MGRGSGLAVRPRLLCRRGVKCLGNLPEHIGVGTSAGEGDADAAGGFDDAGCELDQPQPDGGELGGP